MTDASDLPFTSADLQRATVALRQLGLRLLRDVLNGGHGLEPREWLDGTNAGVFGGVAESWKRRFSRVFHSTGLTPHRIRIELQRTRPGRLARKLRASLALVRRGPEGFVIPDTLWPLLAKAAWEAPRFQLRAARLLTEHMRRNLIVAVDELPPPHIAAETIWLLIAAAPVRISLFVRLGLKDRNCCRAVKRLQFDARRLAGHKLPSDFWAQWITWHVSRSAECTSAEARDLTAAYERWYPGGKEPADVQRP